MLASDRRARSRPGPTRVAQPLSFADRTAIGAFWQLGRTALRVGAFVGVLCLSGCYHSYAPVNLARAEASKPYPAARITTNDGAVVLLDSVSVKVDSIIGYDRAQPPSRVALPRAGVRSIETRAGDPGKVAVAVIVGVMLLAWMAVEMEKQMPSFGN